ncbi:hypothetical protein [Kribbella sp. C-35]|uniref:hypothetical protein n=1 Tax=Kribbella sp. C-35 TaxID=2789276 RepID=UPI00397D6F0A
MILDNPHQNRRTARDDRGAVNQLGLGSQAAGAFLSIDPGSADLAVPARFGASGGQALAVAACFPLH